MAGPDLKAIASEFLQSAQHAASEEEILAFMAPGARHHNAYYPAGMTALARAMAKAAKLQPEHLLTTKQAIQEGDTVMTHSHYQPNSSHPGYTVAHVFRFEGDKIAELWDFGQAIDPESPNHDGMF